MRNASPALIALLNSGRQFAIADVLTIQPLGGTPTYLTSAAVDVTVVSQVDNASHTFKSGGTNAAGTTRPTFATGAVNTVIGTEVDNLSLTLMCDILATVSGLPWTQQAVQGYLDGALIALERAFSGTWGDWSPGTLIRFWGRVSSVKPSRNTIEISVASDLILLERPMPRNLFTPGCLHNLYDSGCTLSRAAFTVSNAAIAGSTPSLIHTTLAQAAGYFDQGAITFTSGLNTGIARTVKEYLGTVAPSRPFPYTVAIGDTFHIYPGCDKSQATCDGKFSNLTHFRGFPYIPTPESGS